MDNSQKITNEIIQVSGMGQDKQEAVADGLSKISKIVRKKNEITVQITPLSIEIDKAECKEYTERFLFIFLPRKRSIYNVSMSIKIEIKYMDLSEIDFTEKQIKDPNGVRLPGLNSLRSSKGS
ncbi:DUF4312 family protein [Companilactobacillus allii]|uniref:Cytoplasmic protein n=1 Tax=Companilactobacillus allii TaxID=1847728 RepID=A0A1P8Q1S5_9LACO|nr:DUF4312 family protein [Companilactobacillus allii]APX71820.1 hypothetical protein BTM29_04280 [Companilactobacillus allii]USQ68906.1 DUF4312 family protein [Companilactobacillus allii]